MPAEGSAGEVVPIISVVVVILSLVCVLNCTGVVPSVDLPADVFIDDTPFVVFIVESDGTVDIPVVNCCWVDFVVDSGETVEVTVLNGSLTCDDTGGVVIVEGIGPLVAAIK